MSNNSLALALREVKANGPTVIPKQLVAKQKPTRRESMWIYPQAHLAPALFALMCLSIYMVSIPGKDQWYWITGIIGFGIALFLTIPWAISDGDCHSFGTRRDRVRWDRMRRGATHAYERVDRATDVVYDQFSVQVKRSGEDIRVAVARHSGPTRSYWMDMNTDNGVRFTDDRWEGAASYFITITNPTLDKVAGAIERASEVAADMERAEYQKKLKERKIERLALLYAAPKSGHDAEALVLSDEIDDGLASLLNP